jgi:hypothetical protein
MNAQKICICGTDSSSQKLLNICSYQHTYLQILETSLKHLSKYIRLLSPILQNISGYLHIYFKYLRFTCHILLSNGSYPHKVWKHLLKPISFWQNLWPPPYILQYFCCFTHSRGPLFAAAHHANLHIFVATHIYLANFCCRQNVSVSCTYVFGPLAAKLYATTYT